MKMRVLLPILFLILVSCNSSKKLINKAKSDSTSEKSIEVKNDINKDSTGETIQSDTYEKWTWEFDNGVLDSSVTVKGYDAKPFTSTSDKSQIKVLPHLKKMTYEKGALNKVQKSKLNFSDKGAIKEKSETQVSKQEVSKDIEKQKVPWLGLLILGVLCIAAFIAIKKT